MPRLIEPSDLTAFVAETDPVKLSGLCDDAVAIATLEAPCLSGTLPPSLAAAAKAVLRGALIRYIKSGEQPNKTWEAAGPFSQGFAAQPLSRGTFFPSELAALRKICSTASGGGGAFVVDTAPTPPTAPFAPAVDSSWLTDIEQ